MTRPNGTDLNIFGTLFRIVVNPRVDLREIHVPTHASKAMLVAMVNGARDVLAEGDTVETANAVLADATPTMTTTTPPKPVAPVAPLADVRTASPDPSDAPPQAPTGRTTLAARKPRRADAPARVSADVPADVPTSRVAGYPVPRVTADEAASRGLFTLAGIGPIDTARFPRPDVPRVGLKGRALPGRSGFTPAAVREAILKHNDRLTVRERTFLVYAFGLDGGKAVPTHALARTFGLDDGVDEQSALSHRAATARNNTLAKIGLAYVPFAARVAQAASPETVQRVKDTMKRVDDRPTPHAGGSA